MITINIGKNEYNLCETANDINGMRHKELKDYMVMCESGVGVPALSNYLLKYKESINNQDIYTSIVYHNDFVRGLQLLKDKKDPYHYIYALIVTEKDEDLSKFSESKADEKLKVMFENGLTQGEIEETVKNFLNSSTTHFVVDTLQTLEILKVSQS